MQKKNYHLLYCLVFAAFCVQSCAVVPRCPGSLMPVVEIQVNNTESNHDDYIGTAAFIPCRARITNVSNFNGGQNFPGGVEVEVRNRRLSSDLIVSTTSSGSTISFFQTLPGNGNWFNFFIRGNIASVRDKSSIIEIATAGTTCNEVVTARKGLMVTTAAAPIAITSPKVEIQVGSVSTLDDYIAWNPVFCSIKWLNPPASSSTLNVTVRNMAGADRLRFSATQPATGTTATNTTASLTLSGDGTWANFYLAGFFNPAALNSNGSVDDKDAVFEVLQSTTLLSRDAVMVRVRKEANQLTTSERDRYLEALREMHQVYNFYDIFKNSHSRNGPDFALIAHRQAHAGSAFLPWHRAFMLHFERLLQSSDPSVALPYWHFDNPSPNMFNTNFLGSNPTAPADRAILNPTNPISTWTISGEMPGIRRRTPYGDNGIPSGLSYSTEIETLAAGSTYNLFKNIENRPHAAAHSNSGVSISWIASLPSVATYDPLFYFLHSNIDRLWGKWQWINNRFDATQADTYDLQGGHSSSPSLVPEYTVDPEAPTRRILVNRTYGQYAKDSMWPWDNKTGTSLGIGTLERPIVAPLTPFPITLGGLFPLSMPTVEITIDYRLMNFGYNDFSPYAP